MPARRATDITVPKALAFALAIGACSWSFNTLQSTLGFQGESRAEIQSLKDRVTTLENNRHDRDCGRD